jgi:ABC-type nickel/cobalt efflux system permease component RcnA
MVPAPSALIVLLAGIALGRAWFGVLLVLGYGIGMALALTGTGVALAYSRDRIEAWASSRRLDMRSEWALKIGRALPTVTATLVMIVGVGLILRAAATWTV